MTACQAPSTLSRPAPRDPGAEGKLVDALGVPALVAAVLVQRGFGDPEAAHRFLNPSLDHLHDPSLLPDYAEAGRAILNAKDQGQKVYVHGDYDADGVTSTALFTRFLKKIGCDVTPHVPHRIREGYGIHLDAVREAREQGAELFLTCDCGIGAIEQVKAARELGMHVVVTDHHQVGETLPEALAVVNPHRSDFNYPWPELAGVGVVFKLCAGISAELGIKIEQFYRAYLDLAVLGTVADVMPLLDENRVIARHGLDQLAATRKPGLQALLRVSDLAGKPRLTARNVGFQLGPRLNAAGRIDEPETALNLLLSEDDAESAKLARKLDEVNQLRRTEQDRSVQLALERIESEGVEGRYVIVLSDPTFNPGIVGLIAGRLVEKYGRPAFVFTEQDGVLKGSARSIATFDVGSAVTKLKGLTLSGGGHAMAAGASLKADNIVAFEGAIEQLARNLLRPEDLRRTVHVDVELTAAEARNDAIDWIRKLEPFGAGNHEPVFAVRGIRLASVTPTSKPEHARVAFETSDGLRAGMAFGNGEEVSRLSPGATVDVAFSIDENEFKGSKEVRWRVREVQPSSS